MAYSHIDDAYASAQTTPSVTMSTTGADIGIIGINAFLSGNTLSIDDALGNTWTPLTAYGTAAVSQIWYSLLTSTSSGHTITVNTSNDVSSYATVFFAAFSGSKSSSTLDSSTGTYNASSVTSIQPGSIVPTYTGDLIISLVSTGWSTNSINESFTVLKDAGAGVSGQYFGGAMAFLIDTNSTVNPTWSGTPGGGATVAIAAFRSADGSLITGSFNPGWAYRSTGGIIGVS